MKGHMMTTEELIADLSERIDNGLHQLADLRESSDDRDRRAVLMGKIEGLALVKDWLRSYPPTNRPPERGIDLTYPEATTTTA